MEISAWKALTSWSAVLGLSACSLLFSPSESGAEFDAGETILDDGALALDAMEGEPDAEPLKPCGEPNLLRIFRFEGNLNDDCVSDQLIASGQCLGMSCFGEIESAEDALFIKADTPEYFTLTHAADLEHDNLEFSMRVRTTSAVNRVGVLSKDRSANGAGHFAVFQVSPFQPDALRYFALKIRDGVNEEWVCSGGVSPDTVHTLVVQVGTGGASVAIDGVVSSAVQVIRTSDNSADAATECTPSAAVTVKPPMTANTLDMVIGATNEQSISPGDAIDRPFAGGYIDDLKIRGFSIP